MPKIFFYGPKLDKDKSREMIESFTETASRLTDIDKSDFVVYLRESTTEDVEVGVDLLKGRKKGGKGKILILKDEQKVSDLVKNF